MRTVLPALIAGIAILSAGCLTITSGPGSGIVFAGSDTTFTANDSLLVAEILADPLLPDSSALQLGFTFQEVESGVLSGFRGGDVAVDGVSLLGVWRAARVAGDAQATNALQAGRAERRLYVAPGGRSTYLVRAGEAVDAFAGRIVGNRVTFDGLRDPFVVTVAGSTLSLRDAAGIRTFYERTN